MQRKRPRGYYSEAVELGTHILPVARMRKFTMSNAVKYLIIFVIAFIIFSVYQKASKPEAETDYWSDDVIVRDKEANKKVDLEQQRDAKVGRMKNNEMNVQQQDELDRRVKQEINKVFEEFKRKQEEKMIKDKNEHEDVFKDYQERLGNENINAEKKFIQDNDDVFGDRNAAMMQGDNEQRVEDGINDAGDDAVENDLSMFEVEENKEKEKEELEIEREIEERLADAFKDAIIKAEEDVAEKKPDENNEEIKKQEGQEPDVVVNDQPDLDIVKVPDFKPAFQKKEEFKYAVNNVGRNLNPVQIHNMNVKARREALVNDDDHEFPPFVTAVRETTVKEVTHLVASIQDYFPGRKIYIYDLDLNKDTKRQLMSYCGVKLRYFMKEIFPSYVKNLDNLHWKPIVMQTALAELGHMIWVNPQYRLTSHELAPLVHESHEKGILAIGQLAAYTTYAATHPDMLKFIPTDIEKLSREPHLEIRALLIHNMDEVHQNIMKLFTACAMEDSCLAPEGSKWSCSFDFTGRKPAGCHRYDESALNILLKNWFNFDTTQFARQNSYFKAYDSSSSYRPKLKSCREPKDIKDREL